MRRTLLAALAVTALSNYALAQSATGGNKVTVLTEGYVRPIEGREFIPGKSADGARNVAGTVVLVRGEDVTLVADPGMVKDRTNILAALKEQGVAPEDVTHVFISHHHPDHTVNIALFPNAEVVDFWGRYRDDLWQDHADGYELAPGIKVLRTPGHTDEDATLLVETADGTYALTHLWWFPDMTPAQDPLASSQADLDKHRQQILEIADWIVPGHGQMFRNPQKSGR
ncbi:Glyoxylase, beta-lactamase superfamily II [Microbulbifer donghaiensis]|uniref:Metallo-beta-lactamase domain-containing protein 1 n=1 Tax=Microbulbifer donghaiensis TaxID=494016 RepID=A0A1M4VGE6_9GAMM|nr:MBL fold metallo-hydrolase [Microbulbifer donghaiensis]SHE68041.1 Glyoxylase, beta-lactamase superfamily II [Microbulbifer donghaiensis]